MKDSTRKARLAALLGIDIPKPPTKKELEEAATISREAEAVLAYADGKIRFIQRECGWCEFVFAVNRSSIAYCSDTCRKHAILRDFHIVWDPSARSLEDRWAPQTGGPEPLIVPPSVLPIIQEAMVQAELRRQPVVPGITLQPEQSLDELLDLTGLLD